MSDHAWVAENVASYVAGGLDPEERELLEVHVAGCAECARALDDVRSVDRDLGTLFAAVRPNPALEDRSIQVLRQDARRRHGLRLSRGGKIAFALAAAVLLAAVGAVVRGLDDQGGKTTAKNSLKLAGLAMTDDSGSMAASDGTTQRASGLTLGEDLVGGTILAGQHDPEKLVRELREKTYTALIKGVSHHGFNYYVDGEVGKKGGESWKETGSVRGGTAKADDLSAFAGKGVSNGRMQEGSIKSLNDGMVSGLTPSGKQTPSLMTTDLRKGSSSGPAYFKPGDILAQLTPPKEGPGAATKSLEQSAKVSDQKSLHLGFKVEPKADVAVRFGDDKKGGVQAAPAPEPLSRKIIRSGEIEFEVDSFDAAVAAITRLVAAARGGFIATVNSDKLPNGKVRGSVVVRMPPDKLDGLVLDLRKELGKAGELKGQRIGSQDITKQYTDLESRLRAARTMEERLLKIIKDGKGQIKDLVLAEKELGTWRTRVEELEGELRYYAHMVALSTLTVQLTEKEIRQAASVTESERVQAAIEVDDVEKAFRAALNAIAEAEGRVTRSDLKQQAAGQFNAVLQFEVEPDAAGVIRDRLRQLGTMVRLDIDRLQKAEGGTPTLRDGKVIRGPTQFTVSLYNLVNVAPRETVTLKIAAVDVRAAQRKLREAVGRAKGRVNNAQLNEQDRQNVTGQLDFDVRRADEDVLQAALTEAGEMLSRQVNQLPAGENVTDAKVLFKVELVNAANVPARETTTLAVEVSDVEAAQAMITAQVGEVHGRIVQGPEVGLQRSGQVLARIVYDVPLASAAGVVEKIIKSPGRVRVRQVVKNAQAPEGKLALARLDVTLSNAELLVPGEAGLWSQVRNGLALSLRGLSFSVMLVIVGVLFVLPWALIIYAIVWLVRRLRGGSAPLTPAAAAPAAGGDAPIAAG